MTLRDKLHARIDALAEADLRELEARLDDLERAKAATGEADLADTLALWEALAEPIEDEEARAAFAEAVRRRPFFGGREFTVRPD